MYIRNIYYMECSCLYEKWWRCWESERMIWNEFSCSHSVCVSVAMGMAISHATVRFITWRSLSHNITSFLSTQLNSTSMNRHMTYYIFIFYPIGKCNMVFGWEKLFYVRGSDWSFIILKIFHIDMHNKIPSTYFTSFFFNIWRGDLILMHIGIGSRWRIPNSTLNFFLNFEWNGGVKWVNANREISHFIQFPTSWRYGRYDVPLRNII